MIVETYGRVTLTCDVCFDAQVALDSNDETRRPYPPPLIHSLPKELVTPCPRLQHRGEAMTEPTDLELALTAAETGSAGHWPTVAAVLRHEVERLTEELARTDDKARAAEVDRPEIMTTFPHDITNDSEAWVALPDCEHRGGTGKNMAGSPFEAV